MQATSTKIAFVILGLAVLGGNALAQRTDSAFTASGRSCSDIVWQSDVLARYPEIGSACQGVVEYDGRDFVRFDATVRSIGAGGRTMTMQFKDTENDITLDTPEDMRVYIEGRSTRVRDLARGQELTFHVPADRFVAAFFDPNAQTEVVAVTIIELPPQTSTQAVAQVSDRTLPRTAGFLPLLGLLGVGLVALGGALHGSRVLVRR